MADNYGYQNGYGSPSQDAPKSYGYEAGYGASPSQPSSSDQSGSPDWISKVYHPVIEGAAMTAGGAGGVVLGAAGGPVGSTLAGTAMASAMYSPARKFANAIDQYRGMQPEEPDTTTPINQSVKDFGTGLGVEATGAVLGPVINYIKPSIGLSAATAASREARTGVPARQFQALYNDPGAIFAGKNLKQAGQDIGAAKIAAGIDTGVNNDLASLTPDNIERINPTKSMKMDDIQNVVGKIQNGQSLTPQEAQNALDSVNGILSQPSVQNNRDVFRQWSAIKTHINGALADVAPDVRSANQAYAREKLGQDFSGMEAVNKNGKPSKLGMMAQGGSAAIGALIGSLTGGHPFVGGGAGYEVGKVANQLIHAPYVAGLQTAIQSYLDRNVGPLFDKAGNAIRVPAASAIQDYVNKYHQNNQGVQ